MTPLPPKFTVPEVLPLVQAYYSIPGNGVGGSLHIVLDDDNVQDWCVDACIERATEKGDHRGEALARILRSMSRTQRLKLSHAPGRLRDDDPEAPARFDAALASLRAL